MTLMAKGGSGLTGLMLVSSWCLFLPAAKVLCSVHLVLPVRSSALAVAWGDEVFLGSFAEDSCWSKGLGIVFVRLLPGCFLCQCLRSR